MKLLCLFVPGRRRVPPSRGGTKSTPKSASCGTTCRCPNRPARDCLNSKWCLWHAASSENATISADVSNSYPISILPDRTVHHICLLSFSNVYGKSSLLENHTTRIFCVFVTYKFQINFYKVSDLESLVLKYYEPLWHISYSAPYPDHHLDIWYTYLHAAPLRVLTCGFLLGLCAPPTQIIIYSYVIFVLWKCTVHCIMRLLSSR